METKDIQQLATEWASLFEQKKSIEERMESASSVLVNAAAKRMKELYGIFEKIRANNKAFEEYQRAFHEATKKNFVSDGSSVFCRVGGVSNVVATDSSAYVDFTAQMPVGDGYFEKKTVRFTIEELAGGFPFLEDEIEAAARLAVSEKELQKIESEKRANERERALYERLKAKYEG